MFPTTIPPEAGGDSIMLAHRYASAGDPRDFEALVATYQSMVIATCRRVLGTHADAEDACQETFLKLARHAGGIRSNLGAWLHTCARQTSIDLLRRGAARDRAEAAVVGMSNATTGHGTVEEKAWHEVRPVLDAALEELDESDRELIVTRFLMGRPQTEMAASAGITAGSMHRRIDKALDRLREKLKHSGLLLGAGVALPVVLGHAPTAGASVAASPVLAHALREIGLAGMTTSAGGGAAAATTGTVGGAAAAGAGLSAGMLAAAVSAMIVVATAGGVVMMSTFGAAKHAATQALAGAATAGTPAAASAPTPLPTPRPTRNSEALQLAAVQGAMPAVQGLRCEGNTLVFEKAADQDGPIQGIDMAIDGVKEGGSGKQKDITIRVTKCTSRDEDHCKRMLGHTMTMRVRQIPAGLALTMIDPTEMGTLRLIRDPKFKPPTSIPPASDAARVPELLGNWKELHDWVLTASKDDLTITHGPVCAYRFRVIEWTEAEGFAKVQAICADSGEDGAIIGSRIKLLVRKEAEGYTIVHHVPGSKKLNEWPAGFESKPGSELRVLTFRKEQE
jgi:RNA polymerase sigma factor (sigma-70 family)